MSEETMTFHLYRLDTQSEDISGFYGKKIEEINIDPETFGGYDNVSFVKETLKEKISLHDNENITLYFKSRIMEDDKLFYADHFILLPASINVFIHQEHSDSAVDTKIKALSGKK